MDAVTYDLTWQNPSAAQQAAREHAIRWGQAFIRGHRSNETALAEVILFAPESLWFTQVKSWLKGQYPAQGADQAFRLGAMAIALLVARGYTAGRWWDARQVWPDPELRAIAQLAIVEAVRLVREIRESSLALYSAGFETLPYLMVPGLNVEPTIRELGQGAIAAALARIRQADAELQ